MKSKQLVLPIDIFVKSSLEDLPSGTLKSQLVECMKPNIEKIHEHMNSDTDGLSVKYALNFVHDSQWSSGNGRYSLLVAKKVTDSVLIRDREIVVGVSEKSKSCTTSFLNNN